MANYQPGGWIDLPAIGLLADAVRSIPRPFQEVPSPGRQRGKVNGSEVRAEIWRAAMKVVLNSLEGLGRAFGWIVAVASAVTAFAAYRVSSASLQIAQTNLRYQMINSSLQLANTILRSSDDPGLRNGVSCMEMINEFSRERKMAWVATEALEGLEPLSPKARKCFVDLQEHTPEKRESYVSYQIYAKLDSYYPAMQAVTSGAFDRKIICDNLKGLVDDPRVELFFREVLLQHEEERKNWSVAEFFYRERPCGW
jgi:hypothetical protein